MEREFTPVFKIFIPLIFTILLFFMAFSRSANVFAANIAGDLNGDQAVNINDSRLLISDFGSVNSQSLGRSDLNGDGRIDIFDLNIVTENFGVSVPSTGSGQFSWIHTDTNRLANASNQIVVFRGFVFIAEKSGNPYNQASFQAAKSFGANYQSIKVLAGAAGYGSSVNQSYLNELSQMVQLAEQQGMYSDLKLTVYDIPGFDWTAFWRNQNGEQDKYLQIWTAIWQRFAADPGVIGFDLLNEPEKGLLALTDDQFQTQYLTPFYQKAINLLRGIDQKHIAFFQPEFNKGPVPYTQPPSKLAQTAYAPHFYPSSQSRAVPIMTRFVQEASTAGVPLFIGEYGALWQIANDGNTSMESQYEQFETGDYSLFSQYGLSYSRPWFADDRVTAANPGETWSIFKGTTGNLNNYRTWIIRPFAAAAGVTLP